MYEPSGDAFTVHEETAGTQSPGSVTALAGGGFVATWREGRRIFAQFHDQAGRRVGSPTAFDPPDSGVFWGTVYWTALPDGGAKAAWVSQYGVSGVTITTGTYAANGAAVGMPAVVTVETGVTPSAVELKPLPNGDLVVSWETPTGGGSGRNAHVQTFSATGQPLAGPVRLPTLTEDPYGAPRLTLLPGGDYLVTQRHSFYDGANWESGCDYFTVQRFRADGTPVGGPASFASNKGYGELHHRLTVPLPDGGHLIGWQEWHAGDEVYLQRFDAQGRKVGAEFTLGAWDRPVSEVLCLPDGTLLVTWEEDSFADGIDVFGQRVTVEGVPVGDRFQLNQDGPGDNRWADLTVLADGRLLATWQADPPGSVNYQSDVQARIFVPGDTPPVATDDWIAAFEGTPSGNIVGALLGNDEEYDGDALRIVAVNTTGTLGQVYFDQANQVLVYTGDPGGVGSWAKAADSFGYTVSDGTTLRTARVDISITGAIEGANYWQFYGTARGDVIAGRVQPDHVLGQGGDDLIVFSASDDRVDGGAGRDVMLLRRGMDSDRVFGFVRGEDKIDARAMFPGRGHAGVFRALDGNRDGVLDAADAAVTRNAGWLEIDFGSDDVLRLSGLTRLTRSDFGNHLPGDAPPPPPLPAASLADDRFSVCETARTASITGLLLANDGHGMGEDLRIVSVDTRHTAGRIEFDAQTQRLYYTADGAHGALGSWATADDVFTYTVTDGVTTRTVTAHVDVVGAVDGQSWWQFYGTAGRDVIAGRVLPDHVLGHGGNDLIVFSAGDDRVDGGAGRDVMVLQDGFDRDRVYGFVRGQDKIDARAMFDGLDHRGAFDALDSNGDGRIDARDAGVARNGEWLEIDFGSNDVLRLSGITRLTVSDFRNHLVSDPGYLFGVGWSRESGSELVRLGSDGSMRVVDVVPGAGSSSPREVHRVGDRVFIECITPETGLALFTVDADGQVVLAADPGSNGSWSRFDGFVPFGDDVYFTAEIPFSGQVALWRLDAGGALTHIRDDVGSLARVGDALYFNSGQTGWQTGIGPEIGRIDADGTVTVIEGNPGTRGTDPINFVAFGGDVYFMGRHGAADWRYRLMRLEEDDTVTVVADPSGFSSWGDPTVLGNAMYCVATAEDGTRGVYRFRPDWSLDPVADVDAQNLFVRDGRLFFTTPDGMGRIDADGSVHSFGVAMTQPWRSPSQLEFDGRLYFTGASAQHGDELFMIDRDGAVRLVADLSPGTGDTAVTDMAIVNGKLHFAVQGGDRGQSSALYAVTHRGDQVIVRAAADGLASFALA